MIRKITLFQIVGALMLGLTSCATSTKMKNIETAEVHVEGNCGQCEDVIEETGSKKGISDVEWNQKTNVAIVKFDRDKTTLNNVMKDIAMAGYKNDLYPADEEAYKKLPACCKYSKKSEDVTKAEEIDNDDVAKLSEKEKLRASFLSAAMSAYFELKAGLTVENFKEINEAASKLSAELKKIDITLMEKDEVEYFKSKQNTLDILVGKVLETKDFKVQRTQFAKISEIMRDLVRKHPTENVVYVKQCIEKSERIWLSEEEETKNPYEGYELLECGKVLETIIYKKK